MENSRRKFLKAASVTAAVPAVAVAQTKPAKKVHYRGAKPAEDTIVLGRRVVWQSALHRGQGRTYPGRH